MTMNNVTIRDLCGLTIGFYVLAQSVWILFVRPDPPAGAVTATRRSRTIIAASTAILATAYIAFVIQSLV